MRTRARGVAASAVAGLIVAGCVMPSAMERAVPVAGFCPQQSVPRAVDAPPDTTTLRWYRSADERDQRLGSDWCVTVGGPVIQLSPTVDFPLWEVSGRLEVVTWNVELGGGDIYRFLRTELGLDCLGARPVLAASASPFVLFLQEAYRFSEDLPVVEASEIIPFTIDAALSLSRGVPSSKAEVSTASAFALRLVNSPHPSSFKSAWLSIDIAVPILI